MPKINNGISKGYGSAQPSERKRHHVRFYWEHCIPKLQKRDGRRDHSHTIIYLTEKLQTKNENAEQFPEHVHDKTILAFATCIDTSKPFERRQFSHRDVENRIKISI